jgi:hypothetical protein
MVLTIRQLAAINRDIFDYVRIFNPLEGDPGASILTTGFLFSLFPGLPFPEWIT